MAEIIITPEQKRIIETRNKNLQVVACAGSGKTESISRRVASLIGDGVLPESIIAFTFTEKAAGELKNRIYQRVRDLKGEEFLGRLGPMFVGTIHGYCFRLLQTHVPQYGNYDVLDEHRHFGFLSREYHHLHLQKLGPKHWQPIRDFAKAADVVGNELIPMVNLQGTPFAECYTAYLQALDRYHFLTFGLIIAKTVEVLSDPNIFQVVHNQLTHLIVDEYQDVNPAQERLIELLSKPPVQLCVVGDDDQSIYQWRGSDIENILDFADRREDVETIKLETNRRSRPEIVKRANSFTRTIPDRLEKVMEPYRSDSEVEVVTWTADTEIEEAQTIADAIERLHSQGFKYNEVAILFRSVRTSAPTLIRVFDERMIPYSCAGRTGLFMQPEINLFGEIYAWFVSGEWKDERFGPTRPAELDSIANELCQYFNTGRENSEIKNYLIDWRKFNLLGNRPVSLVGDFYKLLNFLNAHEIDIDTPDGSARFGAFARFSQVLADYEHVTRRGRYIDENGVTIFRGGRDRGRPFYDNLYSYLLHYARDAYEDYEGENAIDLDAVDIMTVHQAKGLEWPIVFMPGLTSRRFPSSKCGQKQEWILGDDIFPARLRKRYEGSDADERRLFYVALTRARETVYLSYFRKLTKSQKPSPYLVDIAANPENIIETKSLPIKTTNTETPDVIFPPLEISFSDIANFDECGFRYRLSRVFGFQIEIAVELGYGKAIHHVLRQVAEYSRSHSIPPSEAVISRIISKEFYLPFADSPTFDRMQRAAKQLVDLYINDYSNDLLRVWEIERPFEVHFDNSTLAGRADVILDKEDGQIGNLAIVDYKTSTDPFRDERYHMQLAVYASAGRSEGLNVIAGYLHELKNSTRTSVDISQRTTQLALQSISTSIAGIRSGHFVARPEIERCNKCDYSKVCSASQAEQSDYSQIVTSHVTDERAERHLKGKIINHLLRKQNQQ